MPSVEDIESNVAPPPGERGWHEEHHYYSPDGSFDAEFRDPVEVRMSAYAWQFAIVRAESKEPIRHPGFTAFEKDGGIDHLRPYQPWDSQGQRVCLSNLKGALRLFDIPSQTTLPAACLGFPVSALGSLSVPRFVVVGTEGPLLADSSGTQVARLSAPTPEHEFPEFRWFRHGECLWCLSRPRRNAYPRITFFQGATGDVLCTIRVDPNALVPYDSDQYKAIKRDRFSLVIGRGTQCAGDFLDTWSDLEFDSASGVVHLCTYRPTGPVYRYEDTDVCDASEVWVRMRLNP
jgi:hypothetical protein